MDTTTVTAIIKMIDTRITNVQNTCNPVDYDYPAIAELEILRDHLQSFIEGQLNGAENETEQ